MEWIKHGEIETDTDRRVGSGPIPAGTFATQYN